MKCKHCGLTIKYVYLIGGSGDGITRVLYHYNDYRYCKNAAKDDDYQGTWEDEATVDESYQIKEILNHYE